MVHLPIDIPITTNHYTKLLHLLHLLHALTIYFNTTYLLLSPNAHNFSHLPLCFCAYFSYASFSFHRYVLLNHLHYLPHSKDLVYTHPTSSKSSLFNRQWTSVERKVHHTG